MKKIILLMIVTILPIQFAFATKVKMAEELLIECNNQNAKSCYKLAMAFNIQQYRNKDKRDYLPAIKLYLKACKLNHAESCNQIGHYLSTGVGIKKDIDEAIKYYEKSGKLGLGYAYGNIVNFYKKGIEVKQDLEKAKYYYDEGCKTSKSFCDDYSQWNTPRSKESDYKYADGVDRKCDSLFGLCETAGKIYLKHNDLEKAIGIFEKICNDKKVSGCISLGKIYTMPEKLDYKKAINYLKRACAVGKHKACYELGVLYENLNEENTILNSMAYYKKSCELGYSLGCESLKDVPISINIKIPIKMLREKMN